MNELHAQPANRGNSVHIALFVFFFSWNFLCKAYGHPLVTCCRTHVFNCSVASAHSVAAGGSLLWHAHLF